MVAAPESLIARVGREKIPVVMFTVTNNSGGGQPLSMENIRQVSSVCRKHAIPLYFDDFDSLPASPRTLIFIKLREAGDESETPSRLRGRCSAMAGDGCTLSAKKDVLANIGGFLCTNNDALAQQREEPADFSPKGTQPIAVWQGAIWKLWTSATRKLWKKITSDIAWARLRSWEITSLSAVSQLFSSAAGMPSTLMRMLFAARSSGAVPGRHARRRAVFYLEGGIRSVEIGTLRFGPAAKIDLVRLAIPRRVYT